ncbi:MAG TPA: hypothetical protein VM143_13765 [Acidimicrobiales bacterium]|nr:hypothetical protein [Acidimicrobiales bacterium]
MTPTRPRFRLAGLCALLTLAVTVTGCGGGKSSPTATTSDTRPTTTAKLEIVQPTANEETGADIKLVVKLTGAEVVPQASGKLTPDKGHIHVSLDGQLVSMAYGTTQDLHDLKPGPHTVQAEFVAIDHAPFRNRVVAAVLFTVKA